MSDFGTVRRATLALAIAAAVTGCSGPAPAEKSRGPHWGDKAVTSARTAERRAGGFNADERRAYHVGVQHIVNTHQNVGSFTIAQVIDQERNRESQRRDAAAAQVRVKAASREKARRARVAAEDANFKHGTPNCLVLDRRTVHTGTESYSWYIAGKVLNRCDQDFRYAQVEFAFYDASGNRENSGIVNINNLRAGETWAFKKAVYETTSDGGKWGIEGVTGY